MARREIEVRIGVRTPVRIEARRAAGRDDMTVRRRVLVVRAGRIAARIPVRIEAETVT